MFCHKCGTENDNSSVYCSKCGKKLKKQDSKNKNKILVLFKKVISKLDKVVESLLKDKKKLCISLGVMIAIIILNICICVHINNKDINAFKKAFNAEKYEDAKQVYSNVINNNDKNKQDKFDKKIGKYLTNKISHLQNDFINDKNRSDCNKELDVLDQMYYYKFNFEQINKSKEKIKKYSDSRKAFKNGIKLEKNKNYFYALEQFNNVIKDDTNYSEAQNHMKDILLKAKEDMLKKSEEYLLSKVNKCKDKVSEDVTYMPKPYGELIDIGEGSVIFYPYLRGEVGIDVLKLIAGFNRSEWVFTKNIKCNADGEIFDLKFDYFDRKSNVGFGTGIYEWIEIPVLEDTILSDYNTNLNMIDNLKKLGKAKKALIRFEGDTQFLDYELTSNQKNTLLEVIELHEICKG
ncbi:zinc ribbon domain-containing protein [Clostridium novyi]|uniref:Zinc-ribbon domain-containing protein n=2 Tax=Clostridium novyi TaxID=1542 RepID=A0Q1N9_CLONN|nr:zinc ribbon domain-containing protein [Clostridium novyi]ABK62125.1 hypothetical protein NT01CX_0032 [Clostridium novyi NT]